jgi:hypothetical protein
MVVATRQQECLSGSMDLRIFIPGCENSMEIVFTRKTCGACKSTGKKEKETLIAVSKYHTIKPTNPLALNAKPHIYQLNIDFHCFAKKKCFPALTRRHHHATPQGPLTILFFCEPLTIQTKEPHSRLKRRSVKACQFIFCGSDSTQIDSLPILSRRFTASPVLFSLPNHLMVHE